MLRLLPTPCLWIFKYRSCGGALSFRFIHLIAFERTGADVNDICDLPESYLKVFLEESRITEPSIFFSPPAVSTIPTKQKVDRDMLLPATNIELL